MKKLIILILVFIENISYSQSNESLDFYPLSVGNQWTMLSQFDVPPYEEYYFKSVEKDTLINDKIYFKLKTEYPSSNSVFYSFERVDTLTSQVIRYHEFYLDDYVIDSLNADENNFFKAMRFQGVYPFQGLTQCFWVRPDTVLNIATTTKAFQGIYNWFLPSYILAKGFGLILIQGTGWTEKLVYAKIDGIEYGTPVGNITEENSLPKDISLTQNYPNPFNPTTTIGFTLPEISNVEVNIYDIQGNKILILISGKYDSGFYEIKFNGQGLSSGVYFYQLKTNNQIITKQMLFLK